MTTAEKITKVMSNWPVVEMSQKDFDTLPGFGAAQILNALAKEIILTRAKKRFRDVPDEIPVIVEYDPAGTDTQWFYKRVQIV